GTALALTQLGVRVLFLELLQELCNVGLVILCHNAIVFSVSPDTRVYCTQPSMTEPSTGQPTPSAPILSDRERRAIRMIPFIVGCALFMQMVDSTVVATALPVMAADLGTSVVDMNVIITSYLLAVAVFVPVSGWAADRFGSKRVFMAAICLFTLSSIGCALAQTLPQLVIGRWTQGLAGAMMVPVGRIILLRKVPKDELLKAMAFLSLPA